MNFCFEFRDRFNLAHLKNGVIRFCRAVLKGDNRLSFNCSLIARNIPIIQIIWVFSKSKNIDNLSQKILTKNASP